MIHLGDITKLSGYTLPPVDVITGGSPCQDLSVAGKRAGLDGERSGLFMEQIRIVREMRERDRANGRTGVLVRPRYMVWENVPGAFSSNGGRDFQAVLTEIARIAEPDAPDVPLPDNGRWPHSGCIYQKMGGWSIAWRVHDAQFWGVPQRRKRISLVADFGGLSAPEISFERKGLSGDSETGRAQREGTAAAAGCGPAYSIQGNTVDRDAHQNGLGISADIAHTLNAVDRHAVCTPLTFREREGKDGGGKGILCQKDKIGALTANNDQYLLAYPSTVNTLPARMDGSPCIDRGPPIVAIYDARGNGDGVICPTITGDHNAHISDYTAIALCVGNGQLNQMSMEPVSNTLDTMHDQQAVLIAYAPDVAHALHAKQNLQFREDSETYIVAAVDCRNGTINPDVNGTLQAKEQGFNLNSNNVVLIWPEVRRLMPIECERLQGYPDGWTEIGDWTDCKGKTRKEADTPRYKALGNSIALPFWFWLLRRISAQYERPATLGSLFDGIGGFPLCWERCNGPGTALWASEIDDFCIAVTKRRFQDDQPM